MSGFTKGDNEVVFNTGLSMGARVAYIALLHLSWKAGRRSEDHAADLAPLAVLANLVGCSRTAFQGYLTELRQEGLVVTKRIANQRMLYVVFESPARSDSDLALRRARADSVLELGRNLASPRARPMSEAKTKAKRQGPPIAPPLTKIAGQDVALNALCEELGIDKEGPRLKQAVAALHDRGSTPGIRALFWTECLRAAQDPTAGARLDELLMDSEKYERILEDRVRRKVRLIRERQPWRTSLTPFVVRDLWLDIESQDAGVGGYSADDLRRLRETG